MGGQLHALNGIVTFFLWFTSYAEYMGSVLIEVFKSFPYFSRNRSRYGDRLWAGWLGFNFWQGKEILLCSTASIPALVPMQSPIHLVPWILSLGVKEVRLVADHSPQSSAEIKNEEAKPPLPICLHGVALN
jgi:hypothetical protein